MKMVTRNVNFLFPVSPDYVFLLFNYYNFFETLFCGHQALSVGLAAAAATCIHSMNFHLVGGVGGMRNMESVLLLLIQALYSWCSGDIQRGGGGDGVLCIK